LPGPCGGGAEQLGGGASFARHLDAVRVPPAQAARAALANRPDLVDRSFGAIVSLLARRPSARPRSRGGTQDWSGLSRASAVHPNCRCVLRLHDGGNPRQHASGEI